MTTQTFTTTLVWMECGKCGVPFGLTNEFISERRRNHKTFWCPNGCGRHWPGRTDEQKKIDRLEQQVGNLKRSNDDLHTDRAALTYDIRDAQYRAREYVGKNAQRGAFWRGYTDRECGREKGCCPYPTNRFGFRHAWFAGFGADYEEPADD